MVDKNANWFVKQLGYRKAVWLSLVHVAIFIMCILNCFACFYRPDFITTLVCVLSIFFLNDTEGLDRNQFRLVPLLQLMSIIYDTVWLFFIQNYMNDTAEEGGLEASIKKISLYIAWIAYIFKVSQNLIFHIIFTPFPYPITINISLVLFIPSTLESIV